MIKISELKEIDVLKQIDNNKADNFLLLCASPEDRCKGIVNLIPTNYSVDRIFLIVYEHVDPKREENVKYIIEKLKNVGKIMVFQINEKTPIPIINEMIELILSYAEKLENIKISFDFSTMIKWHLFLMLRAFDINKLSDKIRFLYTEPKDYITDLSQPLSFGIRKIFPIPFYSGDFDFSKDSLLILMLGYEGNRALALLEEMDPAECLLLIPKPAYHAEWEGRTEEMNRGIIGMVGRSNIKYIDSRNPIKVYEQLKSILSDSKFADYNHIFSPIGTKPQSLGLFLYLNDNPANTILIYGAPLRHNKLFYSEGIGRSWILPFHK